MSDNIPPFKAMLETKGRKTGKTYKTELLVVNTTINSISHVETQTATG
tara:strand:- start:662 stop:805 length:144 start_codon:yes stop_codon:yes gene_type:complete